MIHIYCINKCTDSNKIQDDGLFNKTNNQHIEGESVMMAILHFLETGLGSRVKPGTQGNIMTK